MNPESLPLDQAVRPGLFRRLAAILYDSVVIAGIVMFVTALVVVPLGLGLGQPEWERLQATLTFKISLRILLMITIIGFHIWFWTHGGQTLGMRAWRLRVIRDDGLPLAFKEALWRYLAAVVSVLPLGLGFLWGLLDPEKLTWHDRWSKTRLLLIRRDD